MGRCALIRASDPPCLCGTGSIRVRLNPEEVAPPFARWALSTPRVREWLELESVGSTMDNLNTAILGRLQIWTCTPEEQRRIVAFLDQKTAVIDELIGKKVRLIELLQEKRQALITQAVTKGLDPNVPMKDSGVEWIGRIPSDWEVVRIGLLAHILNGSTPSRSEPRYWSDGTIPWISSGKVNDYVVSEADEYITKAALKECPLRLLPAHTVLVGMIGQGKTRGMSAITSIPACINQNTAAIVVGARLKPQYVLNVLTAAYASLREFGRGGQQDALNCEIIGAFPVPVPPPTEQDRINIWLTAEVGSLDRMRIALRDSVSLLREYRQALITAAVTGQLDIPAEAA
jgi:type I restriction enzyme, S subunit